MSAFLAAASAAAALIAAAWHGPFETALLYIAFLAFAREALLEQGARRPLRGRAP